MTNKPLSRRTHIVVQEFEKELLICDSQINKAFCLNETSALVWQNCNSKYSMAEIAKMMSEKLKINVSEELVWLALDGFKCDGLLEKSVRQWAGAVDSLSDLKSKKNVEFEFFTANRHCPLPAAY